MSKPKVFISVPMRGYNDEYVKERIREIYAPYSNDYDLVDGFDVEDPPEGEKSITWYLGHSIVLLGGCDLAVFASDWHKAAGCRVERMACSMYGIPYTSERVSI